MTQIDRDALRGIVDASRTVAKGGHRTSALPAMADGRPVAPFWNYYGGKWRIAPRYPAPRHPTIVEPFAGAAGYSLRYADRKVILVEANPVVAGVWRWLIAITPADVLAIPEVDHIDDLPGSLCQEARWLVGFSLNNGTTMPRKSLAAGRRRLRSKGRHFEGWCAARRARIAAQVGSIKHWRIIEGDYSAVPEIEATWFVDPPYQVAGKYYPHRLAPADYEPLGAWCRERRGQVIVCEALGADWLPFIPFHVAKAGPTRQRHAEAIWTNEEPSSSAGAAPPRPPLPLKAGVSAASRTESKSRTRERDEARASVNELAEQQQRLMAMIGEQTAEKVRLLTDLADTRAALRAHLRCDECEDLATRLHAATASFGCDAHGIGEGWSDTTHAAAVRAAMEGGR